MLGCIYGLIAMGFVIVFKSTKVVNFAHASIVMLGAYLVAKWHHSLGFFAAAIVALGLIAVFYIAFTRSDWGLAMRSAASDPEAAALMGIRLSRVSAGAWAVAGALAAIGGAFFVSFPAGGVSNTTGLLALSAIPVAVLGGLDSTAGALVAGLLIGA